MGGGEGDVAPERGREGSLRKKETKEKTGGGRHTQRLGRPTMGGKGGNAAPGEKKQKKQQRKSRDKLPTQE